VGCLSVERQGLKPPIRALSQPYYRYRMIGYNDGHVNTRQNLGIQ